jgi:very-short-patch-repair endonuclease
MVNPDFEQTLNKTNDDDTNIDKKTKKNNNNAGRECQVPGCPKRATFGICPKGGGPKAKPRFCHEHKLDGMVSHDMRHCAHDGCKKRPNFGAPGDKLPTYCHEHRLKGMEALDTRRCDHPGCRHRARYAEVVVAKGTNKKAPNRKTRPVRCLLHKTDAMVNVTRQGCLHPSGCNKYPCYGHAGDKRPTYCFDHKLDGMTNVKQKRCKGPMCDAYAYSPLNKGYCARCFMYLYPDAVRSKKYRTKESAVATFLADAFQGLAFERDRVVSGGCSRYRPDLMCDLMTHVVIVEIDEHQHECYDQECENKRIAALWRDLAFRPVVVVRFNPDGYTETLINNNINNNNDDGIEKSIVVGKKRHGSCFKYDAVRGAPYICRKKEWDQRLSVLKSVVSKYVDSVPEKSITVERLFYDTIIT